MIDRTALNFCRLVEEFFLESLSLPFQHQRRFSLSTHQKMLTTSLLLSAFTLTSTLARVIPRCVTCPSGYTQGPSTSNPTGIANSNIPANANAANNNPGASLADITFVQDVINFEVSFCVSLIDWIDVEDVFRLEISILFFVQS